MNSCPSPPLDRGTDTIAGDFAGSEFDAALFSQDTVLAVAGHRHRRHDRRGAEQDRSPEILGNSRVVQLQFAVVGFDAGVAVRNTRHAHASCAVTQAETGS